MRAAESDRNQQASKQTSVIGRKLKPQAHQSAQNSSQPTTFKAIETNPMLFVWRIERVVFSNGRLFIQASANRASRASVRPQSSSDPMILSNIVESFSQTSKPNCILFLSPTSCLYQRADNKSTDQETVCCQGIAPIDCGGLASQEAVCTWTACPHPCVCVYMPAILHRTTNSHKNHFATV